MAIKFRLWSRLVAAERLALVWCVFTTILMAVLWSRLPDPMTMFTTRVGWLLLTAVLFAVGMWHDCVLTRALRTCGQLAWTGRWYPDTYEFNRCFDNLDHVFASLEQSIFGCQPSLEMSHWLSGAAWSEAFYLGYFSYFPMIAVLMFALLYKSDAHNDRTYRPGFIVLCSFFIYYIIFIFVPVAGPQFYFEAAGTDNIVAGHFPQMGTYFSSHTEMMEMPGWKDGLFRYCVQIAHAAGERPTAAFPSSHIGIATILLMITRREVPRLMWLFAPLYVLLCGATVYIHAHYLIDAIAGLLTAPLVYAISCIAYRRFTSLRS